MKPFTTSFFFCIKNKTTSVATGTPTPELLGDTSNSRAGAESTQKEPGESHGARKSEGEWAGQKDTKVSLRAL